MIYWNKVLFKRLLISSLLISTLESIASVDVHQTNSRTKDFAWDSKNQSYTKD